MHICKWKTHVLLYLPQPPYSTSGNIVIISLIDITIKSNIVIMAFPHFDPLKCILAYYAVVILIELQEGAVQWCDTSMVYKGSILTSQQEKNCTCSNIALLVWDYQLCMGFSLRKCYLHIKSGPWPVGVGTGYPICTPNIATQPQTSRNTRIYIWRKCISFIVHANM